MRRPLRNRLVAPLVALGAVGAVAALAGAASEKPEPEAGVAAASAAERAPYAAPQLEGAAAAESRASQPGAAVKRRPGGRPIRWRDSRAVGLPHAGRLRHGVLLPAEGTGWVSWDPIEKRKPNRQWRRWGTDELVRTTLRILREFRADHPRAARVAIGDLSRPEGGDFGPQFGSIGHATHQNGLDVDVYYPRRDGRERPPSSPDQVDVRLAQDLVDRFLAAGAEKVYVGPSLPLAGPAEIVVPLVNHDNHLHARLPKPPP